MPVDESRDEGEERFQEEGNERKRESTVYFPSFIRWGMNQRNRIGASSQVLNNVFRTSSEHWDIHTFRDRVLSAETGNTAFDLNSSDEKKGCGIEDAGRKEGVEQSSRDIPNFWEKNFRRTHGL